jgi:hypothetical protein
LNALESSPLHWRTSSRSGGNGNCVEVAEASAGAVVRDSKDRTGPVLTFTSGAWTRFLVSVQSGRFDRV